MTDPLPPARSFRLSEEDLALLWHYARQQKRSQRGAISHWLATVATAEGWDVAAIVAAYRQYKATKQG